MEIPGLVRVPTTTDLITATNALNKKLKDTNSYCRKDADLDPKHNWNEEVSVLRVEYKQKRKLMGYHGTKVYDFLKVYGKIPNLFFRILTVFWQSLDLWHYIS